MSEKTIICRCEDLTVEEIRNWISKGYSSFEEIKRATRIGMGPCQGKTCRRHLLNELAGAAKTAPSDIDLSTFRPPTKPLLMGAITEVDQDA